LIIVTKLIIIIGEKNAIAEMVQDGVQKSRFSFNAT
jgi:hypothetical protein